MAVPEPEPPLVGCAATGARGEGAPAAAGAPPPYRDAAEHATVHSTLHHSTRRCPAGHSLAPNPRPARLTATCDGCGATGTAQRCVGGCDYDLCEDCYLLPGIAAKAGSAARPLASGASADCGRAARIATIPWALAPHVCEPRRLARLSEESEGCSITLVEQEQEQADCDSEQGQHPDGQHADVLLLLQGRPSQMRLARTGKYLD